MNNLDAIAALEKAVAICQAEELLEEESRAHNNLGVILGVYAGNFRDAREHYLQAGDIDRRLGDRVGELFTRTNAASSAITMGEFDQARTEINHLESLRAEIEATVASSRTFDALLAYMEHANGNLEEAVERRREWYEIALETDPGYPLLLAAIGLGIVLIQLELPDELESVAKQCMETADQIRTARAFSRSLMAIGLARSGDVVKARAVSDEAEQVHQEYARPWPGIFLRWAQAEVIASEKSWDESFSAFSEAAALFSAAEARFNRAEVILSWSRAHLQRGEPEDIDRARQLMQEAISEFEEMGSPGYANRIRTKLEGLGD